MTGLRRQDFLTALIDEIALEGLDGVTIEGLWLRLKNRPLFKFPLDDHGKPFLWKLLLQNKNIDFFELPFPRKPLTVFNRYQHVDPDIGYVLDPTVAPENFYPHHLIHDTQQQIKGSCFYYEERKNISSTIRTSLPNLDEAEARWGLKLVMVASQALREYTLLEGVVDPCLEITAIRYCLLERIGRSRYLGEVSQGKVSLLQEVERDAKLLFYNRKFLTQFGLITKQVHHLKSNKQICTGSLLHLPRFFVERLPKSLLFIQRVVEILRTRPNYVADFDAVRRELGLNVKFRKLFKTPDFRRFVKVDLRVPYRTLYPDAEPKEWRRKAAEQEKTIQAIQLINPDMDDGDIWSKDNDTEPDPDTVTHLSRRVDLVHDRSFLHQAFYVIDNAGPDGVSQLELSHLMGVTKLQSRTICRNLLRLRLLVTFMNDIGRQRVTRYVSLRYIKESKLATLFNQEKEKMFSLIKKKKTTLKEHTASKKAVIGKKNPTMAATKGSDKSQPAGSKKRKAEQSLSADTGKKKKVDEETRVAAAEGLATLSAVTLPSVALTQDESLPGCSKDTVAESGSSGENSIKLDEIVVTICEEDESIFRGTENVCGFVEEFDRNDLPNARTKESPGVTYRLLKRANLIIETVQANKVVDDLSKLIRLINDAEDKEGYVVKMDKKSLMRLLLKLSKDNNIKFIRVQLKSESKEKFLNFVCLPEITFDHSLIQSVIEQEKLKFFVVTREKILIEEVPKEDTGNGIFDQQILDSHNELVALKVEKLKLVPDRSAAKKYGYCPKFLRMRTLHQFLFYLIHDYQGELDVDQNAAKERLQEKVTTLTRRDLDDLPKIYRTELSWQTFIPPLPKHPGWPDGWAVVCDILLRIPLSIFTKVFNVAFKVPKLMDYLNHPLRCHYLLKDLPPAMRSTLMFARKYIFSFHELLQRLCYIGLAQYGPQRLKEKDQVYIYVNRRASLLDTVTSAPGYHQISDNVYHKKSFHFNGNDDLERYWYEIWNICLHTQLGGRLCMTGQNIVLENLMAKPAMIATLQVRSQHEAAMFDTGEIPGDHKGAAGLDSALFSHLKRNWNWTNASTSDSNAQKVQTKIPTDYLRRSHLANVKSKPINFVDILTPSTSGDIQWTQLANNRAGTQKAKPIKRLTKTVKSKTIVRTFLPKKSRRVSRPWYDELDKMTEDNLNQKRVKWSQEEDDLLLLCKVGMVYICPNARKQVISFLAVRDVVHKTMNISRNKTSRACQRRILVMMKNKASQKIVALLLEEVKQDEFIKSHFGNVISNAREQTKDLNAIEHLVGIKFQCLVRILQKKFSRSALLGANLTRSATNENETLISDNVTEFLENYEVIRPPQTMRQTGKFDEIKTIEDIQRATVSAMVHSTLCCLADKTSYMYQLFRIYQQYSDSILRTVMAKLRGDHMVSMRKSYAKMLHKSGNYLPVSSLPYQLSVSYFFMLQTSFEYDIFEECHQMRKQLLDYSRSSEEKPDQSSQSPMGFLSSNHDGGTAASIVELFCLERITLNLQIPDNIVVLDPHLGKTDEAYLKILARYQDIVRSCTLTKAVPLTSTLFNSPTFLCSDEKAKEVKDDSEENADKTQATKESSSNDCAFDVDAIRQFTLPNEDEDSSGLEDLSDEEDEKDKKDKMEVVSSPAPTPLSKSTQYTIARAASRIALFTMRDDYVFSSSGPSGETQHAHDFLVVNSCKVFCELPYPDGLRPNRFEFVCQGSDSSQSTDAVNQGGRNVLNVTASSDQKSPEDQRTKAMEKEFSKLLTDAKSATTVDEGLVAPEDGQRVFLEAGGLDEDWEQANAIVQLIHSKNELGATHNDLQASFPHLSGEKKLAELLGLLTATTLVQKVGVCQYHYVHQQFMKPWLLHSYKIKRLQREKLLPPVNLAPAKTSRSRRRSSESDVPQNLDKAGASTDCQTDVNVVSARTARLRRRSSENDIPQNLDNAGAGTVDCQTDLSPVKTTRSRRQSSENDVPQNIESEGAGTNDCQTDVNIAPAKTTRSRRQSSENDVPQNIESEGAGTIDCQTDVNIAPAKTTRSRRQSSENDVPQNIESEGAGILECQTDVTSNHKSDLSREVDTKVGEWLAMGGLIKKDENMDTSDAVNSDLAVPSTSKSDSSTCKKSGRTTNPVTEKDPNTKLLETPFGQYALDNKIGADVEGELEMVHVKICPWVRIDGTFNRRVFDRMLGAILSFCLSDPGTPVARIQTRFSPALQPYHTLELLQFLKKLGCVKLQFVSAGPKATLFSKMTPITVVDATGLEDETKLAVKVAVDAVSRLSTFIGDKAYKKDFLAST